LKDQLANGHQAVFDIQNFRNAAMPKIYISRAFYPRFRIFEHQADDFFEEL